MQAYTGCPPKKLFKDRTLILNIWGVFFGKPCRIFTFWRHVKTQKSLFCRQMKKLMKKSFFFFPPEICVLTEVIMCEFYLPIKYIQNLLAGSYVLPVWIQNNYKSKTKQWQIQKIFWKLPPLKLSSPTGCPWKSYLIWMIKESLSKIFLG